MQTFNELRINAPDVAKVLLNYQQYWAHLHPDKEPEKLHEHVNLVNQYASELVHTHGLDKVIDSLLHGIVLEVATLNDKESVKAWLKKLFVHVIVFHDFGKINEHFQYQRMRNNQFTSNTKSIFNPPYGHSFLGTYLFAVYHLNEIVKSELGDEDKYLLIAYTIFLSYSIRQHHSPVLDTVTEEHLFKSFEGIYEDVKKYLLQYNLTPEAEMIESILGNAEGIWSSVRESNSTPVITFPLFALLKLNFSLLTASDYLATHEYMSDAQTTDFGVLDKRERVNEMIAHLRKHEHNQSVFANIEHFVFEHPTQKSNANLNRLRLEMAVELTQTIRQHTGKRLFYIEAPTGGGKTNLSMIALTELLASNPDINKVYYVFPFTTLITQTYKVLETTLGLTKQELVQLHSKAGFASKRETTEDGVFGDDKKDFIDNLFALYPVTVLSHVKFFDILKTNHKETNYLLHRLANSVVIIDELQSYNPAIWDKMLYFISQYAQYFNIRFILMSATLPKISDLNIGLTNQPPFVDLLPNAKRYLQNANFSQRVSFRFDLFEQEITLPELAEKVIRRSEEYAANNPECGSVHTIIEFIYKKTATAFHQTIQDYSLPFDDILVLSGTILEPRRQYIINYLKNKENRFKSILLITTQVVEAGVDIDMDLGFKNISLIDSDEQLAGRVNRNASKPNAEVYLFRLDNAHVLYKEDERYRVTRDTNLINRDDYKRILREKDFAFLYEKVFGQIDAINAKNYSDNFSQEILSQVQRLNYKNIDKNFTIIDQQNESVFVPLMVSIEVESSEPGKTERIFSDEDLQFLERMGFYSKGDEQVRGEKVWQAYEHLIHNRSKGFNIKEKIDFKILQSIMSKFTFSLVAHSKMIPRLKSFCQNADVTYGYLYLTHHENVYSMESGLMESQFDATENYFL